MVIKRRQSLGTLDRHSAGLSRRVGNPRQFRGEFRVSNGSEGQSRQCQSCVVSNLYDIYDPNLQDRQG